MAQTNSADRSLTLAVAHLTSRQGTRRLANVWEGDPHLDGWTPASVLEALSRRDDSHHDALMRGLIVRSQQREESATLLLLAALRPALWKLAHLYHRGRAQAAFDELLVSAVQVIARCDPAIDRLYSRVVGRVRAATPPVRDQRDEQPLLDLDLPSLGAEDDIVDRIEARDRLERLAELRRAGVIDETLWNDLVATRLRGVPAQEVGRGRSADHVRADLSRFSRRLEQLLAA